MKVLVTGGTGYVGRAVVRALIGNGHDPVVLARRSQPAALQDGCEIRYADITDLDATTRALAGVDAICHLAGLTRVRDSWSAAAEYFRVNVGGTATLLSSASPSASRGGVRRFVFASTAAVYGAPEQQPMSEALPLDPPHPYAASKVAAEQTIEWQARTGEVGAVVLRLFNVAGASDPDPTRIVPRVLAHLDGETASLQVNGDGTATRDYLHVDDAASAFAHAVEAAAPPGEVHHYNIGSGFGTSINDIIAAAERVTGRKANVVHGPPAPEAPALVCDPTRAITELNWKPHRSDLTRILTDAWQAARSTT